MTFRSDDSVPPRILKQLKIRLGPSGIHLFNRISGWNLLLDECVPPEATWASTPRHVSIALTNVCDLACSFCFAPKSRAKLSFDRVTAWLDELDRNGTIGVGFGGGEPTLHPQFVELCAYASCNTGLAVTFTTHGHHVTDELLTSLKGNVHFIRVSMDGIQSTYERLRGRPFDSLLHRLSSIREVAAFGINYVVNSDTLPDIDAAATLAEEYGASEFLLLPEQAVNGRVGVSEKARQALREWVRRYSGTLRLAVSETETAGMPICNPFPNEKGLSSYAHIDADGVIKRTSYERKGAAIGSSGIISALSELESVGAQMR